jgi:uncharacterized protein GlcG (DUF336 family)
MKISFTLLALFAAATVALADEHADQGNVATRRRLTLEGAKKVGEAAATYAKNNGAGPSIAVVDDGGYLLYFVRPEESFAAGANVSLGKARSKTKKSPKPARRFLKSSRANKDAASVLVAPANFD